MTEIELTQLLNALLLRRSKSRPSHQIIISFESPVENPEDVEHFVAAVQEELNTSNSGTLDIYGIDLDGNGGEFLIRCNEGTDLHAVFQQLRPILDEFTFLEKSYVDLILPEEDKYASQFEFVHAPFDLKDDDEPELPVPEGYDAKSSGCFGPLTLLMASVLLFLTFLI